MAMHGFVAMHGLSLSSRRAWIEILKIAEAVSTLVCRSPHGERGLKYAVYIALDDYLKVALLTESVD